MQERWLIVAEQAYKSGESSFPSWTKRVLEEWRFVLERFIRGEEAVLDTVLDWRIKNRLIRGFLQSRDGAANERSLSRYKAEVDELCYKYGMLTPDGLFWKIRDRLNAGLPEGQHDDRYYIPSGRARLRVAMMESFKCCEIGWSVYAGANEKTKITVAMDDAASEQCEIHDADNGRNCAKYQREYEKANEALMRNHSVTKLSFKTAREAVDAMKALGVR